MYKPTFSQSLMSQCLMIGSAPLPVTHTAAPTKKEKNKFYSNFSESYAITFFYNYFK